MGYVHDTHMSQFIHPGEIIKSAGTWTPTLTSNVPSEVRTANDSSFTLLVPITLPSNASAKKGAYLKSIDVYYKIATNAADDFATVELEKVVLPSDRSAGPTGAAVSVTVNTAHDTAAERKAVDDHWMTVTLDTAVWIDDDDVYGLTLIVDCAGNTVFTLWGARANFNLRI